jgi:hypothetical protein
MGRPTHGDLDLDKTSPPADPAGKRDAHRRQTPSDPAPQRPAQEDLRRVAKGDRKAERRRGGTAK